MKSPHLYTCSTLRAYTRNLCVVCVEVNTTSSFRGNYFVAFDPLACMHTLSSWWNTGTKVTHNSRRSETVYIACNVRLSMVLRVSILTHCGFRERWRNNVVHFAVCSYHTNVLTSFYLSITVFHAWLSLGDNCCLSTIIQRRICLTHARTFCDGQSTVASVALCKWLCICVCMCVNWKMEFS